MSKKPYKKENHYNLLQSFSFALQGIWFALKWERNLRIHLIVAAYVAYFSHRYYDLTRGEAGLLVLILTLVPTFELFNTAIEKTVDLKSPDFNPLAKIAKDVAAGAVLIASIGAVIIGVLLFWDIPTLQHILQDVLSRWYLWLALVLLSLGIIFIPEKQPLKKRETRQKDE